MPVTPTYPGVYIEELPSGVRTITGVATSITAFIGRALRGPCDKAKIINNFGEYEREFGGLWRESSMSYAVYQFFQNGGHEAVIVRVHNDGGKETTATLTFKDKNDEFVLSAVSPGMWGTKLRARIDYDTRKHRPDEAPNSLFNITIKDLGTGVVETHRNLSITKGHPRFVIDVLKEESRLVYVSKLGSARPPKSADAAENETLDELFNDSDDETQSDSDEGTQSDNDDKTQQPKVTRATKTDKDGNPIGDGACLTNVQIEGSSNYPKKGLYALDAVDVINLLCVPPYLLLNNDGNVLNGDISSDIRNAALNYAKSRRAIFLIDPPSTWNTIDDPISTDKEKDGIGSPKFGPAPDENAAIYFPRIKAPDRLQEGRLSTFVPCGAVAGLIARSDAQCGVWKAPAGIEAVLRGVSDLSVRLTDMENGRLNQQGINCLRVFKNVGRVVWGSRTLRGADNLADQWKYLPVRRLALYIEESLYRGTQWVVFEPNDEPLWSQIRLNVTSFMHRLFRQGAFQGSSPREAYLVKCDKETTTQDDINLGIVNILVGFAPLKPAEFVIIKIQQLAGQKPA